MSVLRLIDLIASDCHSGVHFMLRIDEQSLFRCHVHVKPTIYIIAYKSPPMTIWQFQFINVKCSTFRSHEQLGFWKISSEIRSRGLALCAATIDKIIHHRIQLEHVSMSLTPFGCIWRQLLILNVLPFHYILELLWNV